MKKVILLMMILVLSSSLFGCGSSEEGNKVDLDTPEGVTKEYISSNINYEHAKATAYLTAAFNEKHATLGDMINEMKTYDVLTDENLNKGPDVVKKNESKAKVWYQYKSGKFVKFDLVTENGNWKINSLAYWDTDKDGEPNKVDLK